MMKEEEEQEYQEDEYEHKYKECEIIITNETLSDIDIPQSNHVVKISIWTRHAYLFWFISCITMVSHTYIIGLLQDNPLFSGAMVIIYIIVISIISFTRNIEMIKITCYEYQFVFWSLWIMYSFVCRGLPDYFHYISIIISNIITFICVSIALLPDSYTESNKDYICYLLILYLSALFIPHVDANILHASALVSTTRTLLYCVIFIWIRYNNLLNVDHGEFYNVYYYKEVPTILEIWDKKKVSQSHGSRIVFKEKLYIPPWAVIIITTWVFLCDPFLLLLVPIEMYIIYLMGRYGNNENHKYIVSKRQPYLATKWPFNVICNQSIKISSRVLTTSNTIKNISDIQQQSVSKITENLVKQLNDTVTIYKLTPKCPSTYPPIADSISDKVVVKWTRDMVINELKTMGYIETLKSSNIKQIDIDNNNRAYEYIYGIYFLLVD